MALVLAADLTSACGDDPGLLCEWVHDQTGNDTVAELATWLVDKPLRILLIVVGAWILKRVLHRVIDRSIAGLIAERTARDPEDDNLFDNLQERAADRLRSLRERTERARQRTVTLGAVLRSMSTLVIVTIAILLVLGEVGISLGPLLAGAGIAGIAFGFGAQSLVKDFLAGIFIVIEDQYGVGDIVDLGEAVGIVEEVTLRTTRVRAADGVLWVVPNGEIHRVANKSQIWARVLLDLEVAYNTDIAHATEVIKETADALWHEHLDDATIIEEPEVWGVEQLGASAVVIRLAVKVEPAEQWSTARLLRARIKTAFDDAGIEIPFPQNTVWLHGS